MDETIYEGLPTLALLPANNIKFKQVKELKITIPRSGNYKELNPVAFDINSGEFNLLHDDILYVPSITKVLLATAKYPMLEHNQIFAPAILIFDDDEVEIRGSVLEILSIGGIVN